MSGSGLVAAQEARGPLSQFRCAACGYGASCRLAPDRCPMCAGTVWSFESWRPSGRSFVGADADEAVTREAS